MFRIRCRIRTTKGSNRTRSFVKETISIRKREKIFPFSIKAVGQNVPDLRYTLNYLSVSTRSVFYVNYVLFYQLLERFIHAIDLEMSELFC